MDFSVYRPQAGHTVLSSSAVMAGCQTQAALDMVEWCMQAHEFGLVALDGVQTIIKPLDPGDSRFTFEGLLDDCRGPEQLEAEQLETHIHDLIDTLQPVRPLAIRIQASISATVVLDLVLKGRSVLDAEQLVTRLFADDLQFHDAFRSRVMDQVIKDDTGLALAIVHPRQPDRPPTLPQGVEWTIGNT